ncbi:hypothetical protein GMOD_00000977 [Pyrenophora seminiperda CCB06]|uniref:Uncharacterized protein n=1 Tax=Pyrenophora seminiperda CCB06 TaxID=1302712 RepID=A0A3M7LY16_9PLEO|nr:hypothetical protein GMOD_00000977 [Pyrenophora seminiperda CCB06]
MSFNQQALIDTTPLPDDIPKVKELGASSAPLLSASYFIGARCKDYNDDYMMCKTEANGRGEFDCMKEGRKVTRCAASVYVFVPDTTWKLCIKDINENCLTQFRTHWQCLENHNQQLWNCRTEERKLNKCVFEKLLRRLQRFNMAMHMTTEEEMWATPLTTAYMELAAVLSESPVNDNNGTKHHVELAEDIENVQNMVLTEPIVFPVPNIKRLPSLMHVAHSSQPRLKGNSASASSLAVDEQDQSIKWRNCDLMYLMSIIQAEELFANALVFIPSLEELDTVTYPIHLMLHKKCTSIPPGFEKRTSVPPGLEGSIVTGRSASYILIGESAINCRSAAMARRSLARSLLSNPIAVAEVIDRYNVLHTLYTTTLPQLESTFRAMYIMTCISDVEWLERLAQLRGVVNGEYLSESVDETCSNGARLEIYLLEMGRVMLEDWVRTVRACLELLEGERAAYAEVYRHAADFLEKAFDELKE